MEQTSTAGLTAALKWRRGLALRSQAARGDDAALAAMYERHHQALYRYCRSIVHDDEDARDALQSTMAKALAALRDEERDFELRPWLFRIAHNEAISRLRQRRDAVDLDAVGTLGTDSLAQTVEDRERLALLRADLRDLPDRQRSALVLRELSGLSHEEIAVVLDSSAGAIKQTIFEARAGLHECEEGRTMLCADVQRALSDGDGRVLRGRRVRAHVRSCRACRTFKTALSQRPADLAALAPALPASAGAALLAHLLPGAKAGLASSAGAAAGAGGGMAATVATKVAIVAVATVTVAGTASVVRDEVAAPARDARPAVAAPSSPRARPISASASAPSSPQRAASAPATGSAPRPGTGTHTTSRSPNRSPTGKTKKPPATGALPKQAQHGRRVAKGQAIAQAKRTAAPSRGRRSRLEPAKSHPAHPGKGAPPAAPAVKARPAPPEHPAVAAGPSAHAQPAGAQAPQLAADLAPAVTTPPRNAGATHAAK
jgi:RNA polymerase sigma factor (sigma-70 family)